ncbi:putative acetyltransferase [Cardamine amara subsp. amara]|uniref:Acetyltransferase n=1 Tax=Cardamine amara subsp. amara TaxID=228776 RepID=A0ABD1BCR9_CARAN
MVRSLTSEYYTTSVENLVRNIKIPKFGVGSNCVAVISSPWFQVYDNDFGWGKPIAARARPSTIRGNKLVLFRGIKCIDVHTTLLSDVLVKLLADV